MSSLAPSPSPKPHLGPVTEATQLFSPVILCVTYVTNDLQILHGFSTSLSYRMVWSVRTEGAQTNLVLVLRLYISGMQVSTGTSLVTSSQEAHVDPWIPLSAFSLHSENSYCEAYKGACV